MRRDTATGVLRDDHQMILKVLDAMDGIFDGPRGSLDFEAVREAITFLRLYADACHHGMEEDALFPELENQGIPSEGGPVASLLEDHRTGRGFVSEMSDSVDAAENGDAGAEQRLRQAAANYVDLLRGHIDREDLGVFEMADNMVTGDACRTLCDAYEEICSMKFEGKTKDDLAELAESLAARFPG